MGTHCIPNFLGGLIVKVGVDRIIFKRYINTVPYPKLTFRAQHADLVIIIDFSFTQKLKITLARFPRHFIGSFQVNFSITEEYIQFN